jgi:hypothetical protein
MNGWMNDLFIAKETLAQIGSDVCFFGTDCCREMTILMYECLV